AEASGGDSMNVGAAYAFRETLERIRQRYALHFNLPPTARASEVRRVTVELTEEARRRYPDAQLRYRRTYRTPAGLPAPPPGAEDEEEIISQSVEEQEAEKRAEEKAAIEKVTAGGQQRGRVVLDETERVRGPLPATREWGTAQGTAGSGRKAPADDTPKPVWRTATEADKAAAEQVEQEASKGGPAKKKQ
ncbi:MAG: hypothetical protein IH602_11510, partial [Bryobacteraceae bacterium]|nr:hypothetical protein [Bryobacteraceae bacterium]